MQPSEFWRLRPKHFWKLVKVSLDKPPPKPQPGKLTDAEIARLKRLFD